MFHDSIECAWVRHIFDMIHFGGFCFHWTVCSTQFTSFKIKTTGSYVCVCLCDLLPFEKKKTKLINWRSESRSLDGKFPLGQADGEVKYSNFCDQEREIYGNADTLLLPLLMHNNTHIHRHIIICKT